MKSKMVDNRPQSSAPELTTLRQTLFLIRWINGVIVVLILVSVVGFIYSLFLATPGSQIDEEQLAAEVRSRLAANSDTLVTEAVSFTSETAPPLSRAVYREAMHDLPEYLQTVDTQGQELLDGMEATIKQKVKVRYRDYLARHREVLKEEFPEIASDEAVDRLIDRFEVAGQRLVERDYIDEFRAETKRTLQLWEQFPPVRPPRGKTLEDELVDYLADWAVLRAKEVATEAGE